MAGERQLPGLGLTAFWDEGSNGWADQNDANWRIVSALLQAAVLSRSTSLPGTPTDGEIYIVPTGDANGDNIAIRDNGAWVYLAPSAGWLMYVEDEGVYATYDGSSWGTLNTGGGGTTTTRATKTGAYELVAGDFDGKKVIDMDLSSPAALTVPPGLSVTEPVYVNQGGAAAFTVTAGAGVTLLNKDGLVSNGQESFGTILPWGVDTYRVLGDFTA